MIERPREMLRQLIIITGIRRKSALERGGVSYKQLKRQLEES